jgi:hypothetical protein
MDIVSKKVPNNKYINCPAQMNDGRYATDYRPNVQMNMNLNKKNGIGMNNYKYRQFLIHNAKNIMNAQKNAFNRITDCL